MAEGPEPKKKNPGGRPPIKIDLDLVEKLSFIQVTDEEMATVLGVSTETINRRKKASRAFRDAYQKGREQGRISLRRWQYQQAEKGNTTMLIWLGKQYLNQADKQEQLVEQRTTIKQDAKSLLEAIDKEIEALHGTPVSYVDHNG